MNQSGSRQFTSSSESKNHHDPMHGFVISSKFLELLGLQLQQIGNESKYESELRYEEIRKLNQLKKYIDNHFLQKLSLSQLSRICMLNEFKVKNGFKSLFNTTVFGYIRQLRMEYACQLLRHSDRSVTDIADSLNYQYPHHFSTAFKKYTGKSPMDYRSECKSNF